MGKITVIGIGPGSYDNLTPEAREAIIAAEVVAGYKPYIKLIEGLVGDKEIIGNGMMQEVDRCRLAVESACKGKNTIVVSSGDSGVYGMAGLVLEIILKLPKEERPEVKIIAGLSAVYASAAILGAPLMHDFAIITTAFHELAHSTGHQSRLNRLRATAHFGSESYSKEELAAEISAAALLSHTGLETGHTFKNSTAYIQNWLSALRNDKRLIVTASGAASKAVSYILGLSGDLRENNHLI